MDFLISQMEDVEQQVIGDGYLSKHANALLSGCMDVITVTACEFVSSKAKKQFENLETGLKEELPSADQSEADTDHRRTKKKKVDLLESGYRKLLLIRVGEAIASLKERKQILESVEEIEARTRAAMILLPPDSIDRFSRAEIACERGTYRAISMLIALRGTSGRGPTCPSGMNLTTDSIYI